MKTITISDELWKKLTTLKYEKKYKTLDETINNLYSQSEGGLKWQH